jgi:hypothetical protein
MRWLIAGAHHHPADLTGPITPADRVCHVGEALAVLCPTVDGAYEDGFSGPMRNNLRPNRSCCPVPSHLGQTLCA